MLVAEPEVAFEVTFTTIFEGTLSLPKPEEDGTVELPEEAGDELAALEAADSDPEEAGVVEAPARIAF